MLVVLAYKILSASKASFCHDDNLMKLVQQNIVILFCLLICLETATLRRFFQQSFIFMPVLGHFSCILSLEYCLQQMITVLSYLTPVSFMSRNSILSEF